MRVLPYPQGKKENYHDRQGYYSIEGSVKAKQEKKYIFDSDLVWRKQLITI